MPATNTCSSKWIFAAAANNTKKAKQGWQYVTLIGLNLDTIFTIMIIHRLLIYTSMKHSLLLLKHLALALNSLDTLSDVRIKANMLLF